MGGCRVPGQRGALLVLLCALLFTTVSCGVVPNAYSGAKPPPSGSLSVSFIDVGQGDSILVQAGGTNHLIDAGRPEEGPGVVDFLHSRGVEKLDGIVSTNPDADHVGGLSDVIEAFPVENVYLSGESRGSLTFNNFLRAVRDKGVKTTKVRAGYQIDWGGVEADVLGPPTEADGGLVSNSNDNSVALLLTYGPARVLLAGDAEKNEEEYMASSSHTGPVTIMKVDHHGSNTSSTPGFLNAFPPKIAVIQVGADNSYGHPTPETLARLRRVGARVFRNDENGDVIVTIKGGEASVAVTKP